jgi:hypothetical protein
MMSQRVGKEEGGGYEEVNCYSTMFERYSTPNTLAPVRTEHKYNWLFTGHKILQILVQLCLAEQRNFRPPLLSGT